MLESILLASIYIGLGGAIVCALVFIIGAAWIALFSKTADHRIADKYRKRAG